MKKMYFILLLAICTLSYAQNASDYFPSNTGYRWFYNITPYDSLQNLIDSLSQTRVDSFTASVTYEGKEAKEVLSKLGPREIVLSIPYSDTGYISFETSNISQYVKSLPIIIDSFGIGGFLSGIKGWYSTFKLASAVNTSYSVFTRDTNITYNGIGLIMTLEVKAKRVADQSLKTAIGTYLCKKFILTPAVKAKLAAFPVISYTLLAMNDTVYIAPGNYIVYDNTPSAKVDLSLLSLPSFWIPGTKIEILPPPGVLKLSPLVINVPSTAGDTLATIENVGPGTLKWKARVMSGPDWLTITSDTAGVNNATLNLHYLENVLTVIRTSTVMVWDDSSFSPRQLLTITQNGITGITDRRSKDYDFSLSNNYPNPFNPATTIKFSLKEKTFVTLKVFNSLGKEVATLCNETKEQGSYQVQFDGSTFASGVYFYKMVTGTFSSVKKMILMK